MLDLGALIVTMIPDTELHLRSEHQPPIRIHAGIWHRRTNGDQQGTTAVFADLPQDTNGCSTAPGVDLRRVAIRHGALTRLELREVIDLAWHAVSGSAPKGSGTADGRLYGRWRPASAPACRRVSTLPAGIGWAK